MINLNMRETAKVPLLLFILFVFPFIFTSCVQTEGVVLPVVEDYYTEVTVSEKKDLKIGIVAGPYGDMFLDAIEPFLVRIGYTIEIVLYDDYIQPNLALANNEIDLNIFQHYTYLNNFKFEYDLDLSAIVRIPTVSMGMFSLKYKSIDEIEDGASVSIPDDYTNLSRALSLLDAADIVTINPSVDKAKATEADLIENPKNLQFYPLEANILAKSLNDFDLSVINGNFAFAEGLNMSEALYTESLTEGYMNVIAVKTDDLNQQFVRDIINAVHAEEFVNIITDTDGKYSGFKRPRDFLNVSKH